MSFLDITLLDGYVDNLGTEVVQQMLDLYKQQSSIYIEEIKMAVDQASQELWQERCHKMKGAAGSIGLLQLHKYIISIEKSRESSSVKYQELAELIKLNDASLVQFEQWLASK